MAKKKVLVSLDFENDKNYYYLLKAWDANSNFEFTFNDTTPSEIKTKSVAVVKANLTKKINEATYTLVIIGAEANKRHPDFAEIGYTNWQNFEIARSKANGNKLVGVKIKSIYNAPKELLNANTSWALSFTQEKIIEALNKA